MKEDKKYVWWGLLGIGVAAFFYFLSSKSKTQTIQVPYLVPQNIPTDAASPTTGTSVSEQQNIIGSHQNSTVPNHTNTDFPSNPFDASNPVLTPSQLAGAQPIASNPNFGIPWATYYNPQTGSTYQVT